ncbi:MAG: ESPR-type extended signal peptide-containing protein [Veillonella sp.]|nr:ESPR-type extended signal peptide-containing protein [Veillonella sp.]
MNKIFKVVWSKTKECYVVVSEVAKNNGGKKKVLATVFAALVATGSMVPDYVDAANNTSGGGVSTADASIAIGSGWGNSAYANNNFSIAIGDQTHANGKAAIALGRQAKTDGEEASIAIGNETEATAKDSTAVGSGSKSSGEYAAALGFQTKATANYATAIGSGARGYAEDSQAIGREAETSAGATRAIAIGTLSKSSGNYATSLGSSAEATAERAIAVGYKSKAEAERAISVGNLANATKNDSIAVGNNSAASGLNASAVGKNSKASGQSAAAFGDTAQATNTNATAVGNQANASNTNTTAIGNQTVASGGNATAVGHLSQATADGATAIGTNNKAGYEGTAVGLSNTVTGRTSAAFGRSNTVSGKESLAAGVRSTASGEHNVAIGYQAATDGKATVAIGEGSKADIADGVALGSNSATTAAAGIQGFNPADSRTNTYSGLTGTAQTSTLGAVAVGNGATATRQITGLAAGKEDTDAVNVAQLRSVNLKYAGNSGNSDVRLENGTLNIKGEGLLSTSADSTGITVKLTKGDDIAKDNGKAKEPANNGVATTQNVVQAINNSYWKATAGGNTDGTPTVGNVKPGTQVTYSAGDNLKVKQTIATNGDQEYKYSLNADLKGINSISNSTTGPTMTFGGNSINITGGTLNMGNNKITNVAPGTDDKDAVNYSQIKGLRTEVVQGTGVTVAKTQGADGHDIYTVSANITGGTASTESVVKKAAASGDTNIADVSVAGGKAVNDPGAQYEVSVSKNAVKDAAREAVTINNGGNTNNPITVTPTKDDPNHNTSYAVTFDGAKAAKVIPLTYKANGAGDKTVTLEKGLDFTNGTNTTAEIGNDGVVKYNLKDTVTLTNAGSLTVGGTKVNNDGVTITAPVGGTTTNVTLTQSGLDNGGNKIVNVKAGDVSATSTDAVNGSQLHAVKAAERHIAPTTATHPAYTVDNNGDVTLDYVDGDGNATTEKAVIKGIANRDLSNISNAGETKIKNLAKSAINMEDGKNTKASKRDVNGVDTYKVDVEGDLTGISSITNDGTNNGKISFGPNKTVTVDGDHSITLNASTGTIGGLQNKTFDPTNITSGQAATEDQLKSVNDKFNNKINLGADGNTETTKLALDNNGGIKFNIKGDGSGTSGANQYISTTANGSDIKVDLTQDAKDKLNKTYNVTSADNSVTVKSTTTNGVTTFDLKVAPATGTTSTWDIKSSADTANGGATATGHEVNAKTIENTKTVEMIAGKNLTVKQTSDTNGAKVEFALSDEITVGKDGANGVDGKIGVNGKDGASVVINGKDGSIGLTGPRGATGAPGASATLNVKDGVPGVNGAPGTNLTRIVYTDKNNVEHEVATHDDGMKFAGDDGQANQATNANVIKKKLNNVVDIIGGATKADLTDNNIGVNNDGNGKLLVQLSKNLNGINTIKNGNTTITLNDAPGGTNNTPAVTINGGNLSVGGNKVTNVGDGTANDDAVNVKQLKAAKTEVKAGDNVTVKLTTDTTDGHNIYTVNAVTPAVYTTADGTKVYKIVDPTTNAVTWNTSPDGTGTNVNASDVITSFESPANGTTPGSTTGGTMIVNNVGSAINNHATPGLTSPTYLDKLDAAAGDNNTKNAAVNVTDLKSTADALKSNELHIRPTTSGRTGETVNQDAAGTAESYKYDAATKSVTLKYNDGTGAGVTGTEAKIDLSDLANQITSGYTFKANATANGGTVANDATTPAVATTVENGGTINYAAGRNLTVKQDIDATAKTHTYTYSLNKDLTNLDKVVVNGENGTNGKDGVTIIGPQGATGATGTNGIDGKVGISGKDGKDAVAISGKDGIGTIGLTGPQGPAGADGRGVDITTDHGTQTLNKPEANNGGKSERIVYVPKDKDGNPLKDDAGNTIKREVATMDDGLKFTGNNTTIENKQKLGSLVKVQGEGTKEGTTVINTATGEKEIVLSDGTTKFESAKDNIAVVADGTDTLTVKLNKNLTGINKISNGNSSITLNDAPSATTPAVTIKGGNLSMGDGTTNNKIVNVAPGTEDTDAVNYKQLKAAKTVVEAGKNVVVTSDTTAADGHTTYTVNASTPAVYTKPNGDKLIKQPDGTFKEENGTAYTGPVIASFEDGTGATTGGNMIVNNVGSAIKNQTGGDFLAKLDAAANTTTGTPNAAVNVSDLKSTADALKANERHIAPTTVAAGSTETKGGTANAAGTNVYKYDAASKTVTLTYNDGNGNAVTDTKAVIDLSNLSTGGTGASSWNVKSSANTTDGGAVGDNHNANVQNIADTKTVEFQSGKNLVVKQTNDTTNGNATVEFSLADNIVAGKDGANGKDGSVGATGKDGSSVVLNGKDGSIGMTGPKGQDGKDGINGRDGADISITSAKGEQVLVNRDPAHNSDTDKAERIVYVPKDASGNPIQDANGKNIVREVATMDDGLRFTGNNTGTENKRKLGSLVKVQGEDVSAADEAAFQSAGGNIAVTADGTDTLTIRLNKNLKGLNSIQLGDNTIKSNGDNIEFTTKGGDTVPAKSGKVNLVAGDHITITPDAANGKMTISATGFGSMDGFNVKTSADANGTHAGDTTENIKNGKTVDMQAGKNLVVTQSNDGNGNTTVNYALNKDVDLGTNGSLKTGDTTINNDGFKNGNTTVGGNGMTINNPTDPAKTVSLTKDGLNNGGNQITNVASGGNTDTNGANIGDVKRIAKAGDTRIKDDTYTVDNTGTVELTYVDGAGKQVTDAAGNPLKAKITGITTLDSTRVNVAVNKTGTGEVAGSTAPVKVTKGTEFVAGNNLIVERKSHTGNDLDNSVVYSLNSNLTGINSISNTTTGPKMTFGGNSINVTNGDLNMGGNKITNLAPGKDKTDAATVGQLTKVTSNNHSVVINQTTDANGAPVYDLAVTGTPGAPAADPRVDMLGEEIGRVGAQGAALSALKPIQYDPLEPTQIMVLAT